MLGLHEESSALLHLGNAIANPPQTRRRWLCAILWATCKQAFTVLRWLRDADVLPTSNYGRNTSQFAFQGEAALCGWVVRGVRLQVKVPVPYPAALRRIFKCATPYGTRTVGASCRLLSSPVMIKQEKKEACMRTLDNWASHRSACAYWGPKLMMLMRALGASSGCWRLLSLSPSR